ncbi:hypothetical protein FA13DRAFT_1712624 [Coprinellus micaceus]|uniref:Uncharacterized protein n=1 Tax=Coprinellus micaceus TaxID=71717 RepID=A0A4Y7SZE4_COPMI|nr:hypothetical protein FA13DRAFT_1712624 [Coprinellus micaceus]
MVRVGFHHSHSCFSLRSYFEHGEVDLGWQDPRSYQDISPAPPKVDIACRQIPRELRDIYETTQTQIPPREPAYPPPTTLLAPRSGLYAVLCQTHPHASGDQLEIDELIVEHRRRLTGSGLTFISRKWNMFRGPVVYIQPGSGENGQIPTLCVAPVDLKPGPELGDSSVKNSPQAARSPPRVTLLIHGRGHPIDAWSRTYTQASPHPTARWAPVERRPPRRRRCAEWTWLCSSAQIAVRREASAGVPRKGGGA